MKPLDGDYLNLKKEKSYVEKELYKQTKIFNKIKEWRNEYIHKSKEVKEK